VLRDLIVCNAGNVTSRREFERITGLECGTNQPTRERAVRAWCGEGNYDAMQAARAAGFARKHEEDVATRRVRYLQHARAEPTRYQGEKTTFGEFIDARIAEGFTSYHEARIGVCLHGSIYRPSDGRTFRFKKGWQRDVIKAALAYLPQLPPTQKSTPEIERLFGKVA
jgi:hypothetical protein